MPWLILLALVGLLTWYELWAPKHGLPTITEWLNRHTGGGWLRWLKKIGGAILVGVAIWHLLFGGPFHDRTERRSNRANG